MSFNYNPKLNVLKMLIIKSLAAIFPTKHTKILGFFARLCFFYDRTIFCMGFFYLTIKNDTQLLLKLNFQKIFRVAELKCINIYLYWNSLVKLSLFVHISPDFTKILCFYVSQRFVQSKCENIENRIGTYKIWLSGICWIFDWRWFMVWAKLILWQLNLWLSGAFLWRTRWNLIIALIWKWIKLWLVWKLLACYILQ